MPATAKDISAAYPNAAPIANELVAMAGRLGIPDPGWLANLLNFETGGEFSPKTINRGCKRKKERDGLDPLDYCATGLIQFMPSTSRGLGTNNHALYNMTVEEQLPYVEMYFEREIDKRRRKNLPTDDVYKNPTDIYMRVFFPAAMGKGKDFSIYDWYVRNRGQSAADTYISQNPGIYTAGDYAAYANKSAKLPTGVEVAQIGDVSIRVFPYLLGASLILLAGSFYFYRTQQAKK